MLNLHIKQRYILLQREFILHFQYIFQIYEGTTQYRQLLNIPQKVSNMKLVTEEVG